MRDARKTTEYKKSLILPNHKSFSQIYCFVWCSKKLLELEVANAKAKYTRVDGLHPKYGVCS